MSSLFSPESKFMQTMTRIADLILLNILFLISCIPVVTIGAAFTALYTQVFRIGTGKEAGVFRGFFTAFRENFRQATALWLTLLFAGVCMAADLFLFYSSNSIARYLCVPLAALGLLLPLTFAVLFPLLSQFGATTRQTLKNALLLSIAYCPRALLITAFYLFPPFLFYKNTMLFFETAFIWVTIYFSAAAYLASLLLKKVFAPYHTDDEAEEDIL